MSIGATLQQEIFTVNIPAKLIGVAEATTQLPQLLNQVCNQPELKLILCAPYPWAIIVSPDFVRNHEIDTSLAIPMFHDILRLSLEPLPSGNLDQQCMDYLNQIFKILVYGEEFAYWLPYTDHFQCLDVATMTTVRHVNQQITLICNKAKNVQPC